MDYLVIVIGRSGMGMMGGEVVRMVPVVIKVVVRDPRSVVVVVVMKRMFVMADVVVSMDEVKESRYGDSVKAVGSVWRRREVVER
jgi:nitrate/nitrite transporter NarK